MTRRLVRPWLAKSFLDEALGLGEPCTRKRRVQIIKFLDRPPSFSQRDNQSWSVPAQISDSLHWIPAVLSSECVAALEHDRDLLSINGACIIINKYELKAYPQYMQESSEPRFVCLLYITDFHLLGGDGSTLIGKPELFNDDPRVKELVARHAREYLRNQAYGPLAAGIQPPKPGSEEASQYHECCVSLLTQSDATQQAVPNAPETIAADECTTLDAYFIHNADNMTKSPPTLHECLISDEQWALLDALPGWDAGNTTAQYESLPPPLSSLSSEARGVTVPMHFDEPNMDCSIASDENMSPLSFAQADSPASSPTSRPGSTAADAIGNAIDDSLPCSAHRIASMNLWAYADACYQAHHTLSLHATHQIAFMQQLTSRCKVATYLSSQDFNFTAFTPKPLPHPSSMDWEATQEPRLHDHSDYDSDDSSSGSSHTLSTGTPFSTLASIQRVLQRADSNTFHTPAMERQSEWLDFSSADICSTMSRRSSVSIGLPASQVRCWGTQTSDHSHAGHFTRDYQQAPALSHQIVLAFMHFPLAVWPRLAVALQHAIGRCYGIQWSQQLSRPPLRTIGPWPQLFNSPGPDAYDCALLPNSYTLRKVECPRSASRVPCWQWLSWFCCRYSYSLLLTHLSRVVAYLERLASLSAVLYYEPHPPVDSRAYPDQTSLQLQPLVFPVPLYYNTVRTALGHGASSRRPAHIFRTICVLTLCVLWQLRHTQQRHVWSNSYQTTQTTPFKAHVSGDSDNSYMPSPNIFASLDRSDTSPRRLLVYTCMWSPFSLHRSLEALGSSLRSATDGSSQPSQGDRRMFPSTLTSACTQENSLSLLTSIAESDTAPAHLDVNLQTLMRLQQCYSSCSPPSPTPTPVLTASALCSELPPTSSLSPILTGTLPDSSQPMQPTPHASSPLAASFDSDAILAVLSHSPKAAVDTPPQSAFPDPHPLTQSKSMETMSPVQASLKRAFSDSSLSSNSPHKTPTTRAINQIQPPLIYQSANRAHKGLLLKRQKLDPIPNEIGLAPFSSINDFGTLFSSPTLSSNFVPELVPGRHTSPGLKRCIAGPASRSRKPRLAPPSSPSLSPSPLSSPLRALSSPPEIYNKQWYTTSPMILGKRNPFQLKSESSVAPPATATATPQGLPAFATTTAAQPAVDRASTSVPITALSHRMARASGMIAATSLPLDQSSVSCDGYLHQNDADAPGSETSRDKRRRLELSPTLSARSQLTQRRTNMEPFALAHPRQVETVLDSNPPSPNPNPSAGHGWQDPDYAVNFDEWDW